MEFGPERELLARDYFIPPSLKADDQFLNEAEQIERSACIESHEFFKFASKDKSALELWVSQEAVITNPFSQILFTVMANIDNVHIRTLLMPVVTGEHGRLEKGVAVKSHPWLIWRLCESMGLAKRPLVATKAVCKFIDILKQNANHPMRALGALGIGNELMLLAEYRAVEGCFEAIYPEANYRGFLHGNINEDEVHTALIKKGALSLCSIGYDPNDFIIGAAEGVKARIAYYDDLLGELLMNHSTKSGGLGQ